MPDTMPDTMPTTAPSTTPATTTAPKAPTTPSAAATVPASLTGDYVVDPVHSSIGFVARHAMVTKVRGQFKTFDARAHLDFEAPANSSAQATIEVASVDTSNEQRDQHLRTNDFFDAPGFPQITFVSTAVDKVGHDRYTLTGELAIKDVTKTVSIDITYAGASKDPYGNTRVGFEGTATISRGDWGVTFNAALETGGVLVSDKITLELDLSAIKSA
ncbi:MAG: YceI family protein [Acidimicrobiales bacterium]